MYYCYCLPSFECIYLVTYPVLAYWNHFIWFIVVV